MTIQEVAQGSPQTPALGSTMTSVQTKHTMQTFTSNPYVAQILEKGRDYVPTPAKMPEFPKTVHGRTFETEAEYREAIAEMLNGM